MKKFRALLTQEPQSLATGRFAPKPLVTSGGWGLLLLTAKNSALLILNFWLHACVRVQCTDLQNILAESFCIHFNSVYFCHFWHGSKESDHVVFKVQCYHKKKSKKRYITLALTY